MADPVPRPPSKGTHALVLAVLYNASWAILFVVFSIVGWPGEVKSCVKRDDCFCEHFEPGTVLGQPVNTLTNLAYIVAGFAVLIFLVRGALKNRGADTGSASGGGQTDPFKALTGYSFAYSIIVMTIGIGSFYMHAGQVKWAGTLDTFSMNLFVTFALVYSIVRAFKWSWRRFLLVYVPVEALMLTNDLLHDVGIKIAKPNDVFAAITVALVAWEVALQVVLRVWKASGTRDWRLLALSVGLFLGGYAIWLLEDYRIWPCDPYALLQPHGLWHVLTAAATVAIFAYMRSGAKGAS